MNTPRFSTCDVLACLQEMAKRRLNISRRFNRRGL
jgi:hypothetical protein